jgi:hypothetical protein
MSAWTEEERRSKVVYNFTIATNNQALFGEVITLADSRKMKLSKSSDPDEIIGVNPNDITEGYDYVARFQGSNNEPHPTLQQVWDFAGDLDQMKTTIHKPNSLAPSGNIASMVIVIA